MGESPLILFQHQPKSGGTSLRALLLRQFPQEASFDFRADRLRESHPIGARATVHSNSDQYLRFLETGARLPVSEDTDWMHRLAAGLPAERRGRYRLLLGHFAYGIHEYFTQSARYITILRDPIDRVLSLWAKLVRNGIGIGFHEYLQTARDSELNDGQMRRLIGPTVSGYRWIPLTTDLLRLAKQRLREFRVVGTSERYPETLRLLEHAFGWGGLNEERRNRSPARLRREDLSPRLLTRLEELNRYDLELHRYANKLMDERLAE